MFREGLEVLRGGDKMAFVSCTGDAAQAHTLEAMVGLEVRKAHLDLLALIARFVELGSTHQGACMIAGILVEIACVALGCVWTASRFEGTSRAVTLRRTVAYRMVVAHVAGGSEQLVGGTDVDVTFTIVSEVAA